MPRRTIVAANRLPVQGGPGGWEVSPGGLVTALRPIVREGNGAWIGWQGISEVETEPFTIDGIDMVPVPLSSREVDQYYAGFSNATLWPLFHDAIRTPAFHRRWWRTYETVNQRFADAVVDVARPGDVVWVQDYQLMLVPDLVRRQLPPDASIAFFLHIPFPPAELYARLPWRREIVLGLLGADLVGFQTERAAQNFVEACVEFAGATEHPDGVVHDDRVTRVITAPISIDTAAFEEAAGSPDVAGRVARLRAELGDPDHILLGVDRLDYTKGIEVRLRAFETLLQRQPDLAATTQFIQIAVPSRQSIDDYADMRSEIEQIAGRVNGAHGGFHRMPVHYIYASLPHTDLVAYYQAADVMCVTPLADGMNLVAKEYVASRVDDDGVLLLSEFAGAAHELTDAVLVNPFDLDGVARSMAEALAMPAGERSPRMRRMRDQVRSHDVHVWARLALGDLLDAPV